MGGKEAARDREKVRGKEVERERRKEVERDRERERRPLCTMCGSKRRGRLRSRRGATALMNKTSYEGRGVNALVGGGGNRYTERMRKRGARNRTQGGK